jgi:hypothetical protein
MSQNDNRHARICIDFHRQMAGYSVWADDSHPMVLSSRQVGAPGGAACANAASGDGCNVQVSLQDWSQHDRQ